MAKLYCIATNTGSGFITHSEQENESPLNAIGYPGNVWCVEDNATGQAWVSKVSGVSKTKSEAQAIVNTEVASLQSAWDALDDDNPKKQEPYVRQEAITIE